MDGCVLKLRGGRGPALAIRLVIVVEVGVYREALAQWLERDERFAVVGVAVSRDEALAALKEVEADIALVDTRMPASAGTVRALVASEPPVKVVALNVPEHDVDIMAFAEAGAADYVPRDGSMADLAAVAECVSRDEALCSPGVAGTLFRRVASLARERRADPVEGGLTAREVDVLRLIEEGSSNKEIANTLTIELPTVKNHVHNILQKLGVKRRSEAAALARRDGLPRLAEPAAAQRPNSAPMN
jgi:two-component system nitrate/nitrite response regulator NarL